LAYDLRDQLDRYDQTQLTGLLSPLTVLALELGPWQNFCLFVGMKQAPVREYHHALDVFVLLALEI
jgi:hypothetical protein